MSVTFLFLCEPDGWFNAIEVVQKRGNQVPGKGCDGVFNIALPEAWGVVEALQGSLYHILQHKISNKDTGVPIAVGGALWEGGIILQSASGHSDSKIL